MKKINKLYFTGKTHLIELFIFLLFFLPNTFLHAQISSVNEDENQENTQTITNSSNNKKYANKSQWDDKVNKLLKNYLPREIELADIFSLRQMCKSLGLDTEGTETELRTRLYNHYKDRKSVV